MLACKTSSLKSVQTSLLQLNSLLSWFEQKTLSTKMNSAILPSQKNVPHCHLF